MNVKIAQIWDECLWIIKSEVYKKFKGYDAEDVIQDMAEHLNNKLDKYQTNSSDNLGGWVRMVVRNKCLDILRHESTIKRHLISSDFSDFKSNDLNLNQSSSNTYTESIDIYKKRISIQEIFNNLKEKERQLLILKFLRNKKGKEIEQIMNITNCAQYYLRIIDKIKKNLGEDKLKLLLDEFEVDGNLDDYIN